MISLRYRLLVVVILSLGFVLSNSPSFAFLYQISVLNKNQISELSDESLLETYIDVLVEREASQAFHQTSGFTPKQYQQFKDLLKYRVRLVDEIQKRGLDIPGNIKPPPSGKETSSEKPEQKKTLIIKNQ